MNQQHVAQRQGGKLLADIKKKLVAASKVSTKLEDLDKLAEKLLLETGGQPSFKMVPGYHWSTCININSGIVHGIPKGTLKDSDLVTVDVGLYYQGYHTDTSTSFIVGSQNQQKQAFLKAGKKTLSKAIKRATAGNHIWDISHTIQKNIEAAGFSVVRNLTGHGVGKELHEDPAIPCYTNRPRLNTPILKDGQVIAVEVMYCQGHWATITQQDGWTISTSDGKLSAVFEETLIVTKGKPEVVTQN